MKSQQFDFDAIHIDSSLPPSFFGEEQMIVIYIILVLVVIVRILCSSFTLLFNFLAVQIYFI